jgi:hypothetical protein
VPVLHESEVPRAEIIPVPVLHKSEVPIMINDQTAVVSAVVWRYLFAYKNIGSARDCCSSAQSQNLTCQRHKKVAAGIDL